MLLPPSIIPPVLSPLLHQTAFLGLSCNSLSPCCSVNSHHPSARDNCTAQKQAQFSQYSMKSFYCIFFLVRNRNLWTTKARGPAAIQPECSSCSELSVCNLQQAKGHASLKSQIYGPGTGKQKKTGKDTYIHALITLSTLNLRMRVSLTQNSTPLKKTA